MSADEKNIVRRMHFEVGKSRSEIARLLKRSLSSVSRLLAQKKAPQGIGRPRALTEKQFGRVVDTSEKMVDAADGNGEVTLAMLMRHPGSGTTSDAVMLITRRWRLPQLLVSA